MRRLALWLLVALVGMGGVVALGLVARERARREATVYTDGRTIAVPAADAPLRTIVWTPPEPLPGDVNTPGEDHQPRVSLGGGELFFVRGRPGGGADIWWAKRDGDAWAAPEPIDAINTDDADEITPCPTPSGDALLFASDRPAGAGGYDLWIARRDDDGGWSEPVWLGDAVNTPHNDYAPSVAPDGLWLWFASNRPDKTPGADDDEAEPTDPFAPPPAAADYDIYRARFAGDSATLVTRVEELCSDAADAAPAWSPAGDFVYFASNREGGTASDENGSEKVSFDLYRARIADGAPLEPEPLGPTINTERDEIDPAIAMGGFELLFSVALPADDREDDPDLDLARSRSAEVYPVVDASRMRFDLPALWNLFGPWLLSLLLALLLLLLLLKFRSSPAAQGRWRKMSLLARCLLLSLLIHALLLALLGLWRVSTGIGDLLEDEGGMRIRLTSSRGGVATQLTGAFVAAPAELASSAATSRASTQAEQAPATMMEAGADRARMDAQRSESSLAAATAAERTPSPSSTAVETAASPESVSAPAAVRARRVGESTQTPTVAAASDTSRAQARPSGAPTTSASIEPDDARDQRVAMRQAPASDAAPDAAPSPTAEPSLAATPATTASAEQAERVASGEVAQIAPPIAASTGSSAPTTAIRSSGDPATLASTGAEAADLSPKASAAPALTAASGAESRPAPGATPDSPAQAPGLALVESAAPAATSETGARPTPVAESGSSSPAAPDAGADAPTASLARNDPGRASMDATPIDRTTPSEGTVADAAPTSAVEPAAADAPADVAAPQTQGTAVAVSESAEGAAEIPSASPSRAPNQTPAELSESDSQMASVQPAANALPVEAATGVSGPTDAEARPDSPATASVASGAPSASELALPTDDAPRDALAGAESEGQPAALVADSGARAAPVAAEDSTSQIRALAPEAAAADMQRLDSAPSDGAASDTPVSLDAATVAAATTSIEIALPESAAASNEDLASDTPSGVIATPDVSPRAALATADEPASQAPDSFDPTSLDSGPDRIATDGPEESSLEPAAPPAPTTLALAPAAATVSLPGADGSPAESDSAATGAIPALADADAPSSRAQVEQAESSPSLAVLDVPTREGIESDTPSDSRLADASTPRERPLPASTLAPAAAIAADVPPLPAEPEVYPQRDEQVRQELVERGGGSEETEKAVADALAWLARNQSPDGRWSSQNFQRFGGPSGDPARYDFDVATTALAMLCFLGADHTPIEEGPYQGNVARAIAWLVDQESGPGEFRAGESMYSQAIATIALCESYAMTRDPRLIPPIERAIAFIVGARNDTVGGWRYEPGQPGDTSVLGWMVMAFESARRCGIDIDPVAPRVADDWLSGVMDPNWPGRYAYRPGMESTRSMTAEGMFVRQLLRAERDDPRQLGAARFVLQDLPRWDEDAPTYQWYYATLALFQHGGGAWDRWNRSMSRELVKAQRGDGPAAGSWDPTDRYAQIGGRIYQTAICTLTLEVYYRYLPLYVDEPVAGMGGE